MEGQKRNLSGAACVAVLLGALSGCGGGGGSPAVSNPNNPPDNDPPAQEIQGIATPSGVAVVTATNAD